MSYLLNIRNLQLRYAGSDTPVLDNFSLQISRSELLCLIGPSGCGKSTLLKAAAGLMPAEKGSIGFFPEDPGRLYPRMLVLQNDDQLFPWLTVEQNAAMPLRRAGVKEWKSGVDRILGAVSISEAAALYPHQLSGGMRQRAVLARALTANPELLMLDEPFAHLDASVRSSLQDLVVNIWQQEQPPASVLFVTHDIQEALVIASRIVLLDQRGNIRADRAVDLPRPRDPFDHRLISLIREFRALLD